MHVPTLLRLCRAIATRGNEIIRDVTEGGSWGFGTRAAGDDGRDDVGDAQTEADRRVEAMMVEALKGTRLNCDWWRRRALRTRVRSKGWTSASSRWISTRGGDGDAEEDEGFAPELRRPIALDRVAVYCDPLDGTNEYAAGEREAITVLLGIAGGRTPLAASGNRFIITGKRPTARTRRLGRHRDRRARIRHRRRCGGTAVTAGW